VSFWQDTVPDVVLFEAMQQTSPVAQSAASLHVMTVPAQAVPGATQDSGAVPPEGSQHSLAGTAHGDPPQLSVPGLHVLPPVGGTHAAPSSPA